MSRINPTPPPSASGVFAIGTYTAAERLPLAPPPGDSAYSVSAGMSTPCIIKAFEIFHQNTDPLPLMRSLQEYAAVIACSPDDERLMVITSCRQLLTHPSLTTDDKRNFSRIYAALLDFLPPSHPGAVTEALAASTLPYTECDHVCEAAYARMAKLTPLVITTEDAETIDLRISRHLQDLHKADSRGLQDPALNRMLTLATLRLRTKPAFDITQHFEALATIHESIVDRALLGDNVPEEKAALINYFGDLHAILTNAAHSFFVSTLTTLIHRAFRELNAIAKAHTRIFALCDLIAALRLYLPRKQLAEIWPPEKLHEIQEMMTDLSDRLADESHVAHTPTSIVSREFAVIAALQEWFVVEDPLESFALAVRFNTHLINTSKDLWANTAVDIINYLLADENAGDLFCNTGVIRIDSSNDFLTIAENFSNVLAEFDDVLKAEHKRPRVSTDDDLQILYNPHDRWVDTVRSLLSQAYRNLIPNPDTWDEPVNLQELTTNSRNIEKVLN